MIKVYSQKLYRKYFYVKLLSDTQNVVFRNTLVLLDSLAKLLKATVSLIIPFCLSLRPHGTTLLGLDGNSQKYIFEYIKKFVQKIQS
jgi:hypothetical protein